MYLLLKILCLSIAMQASPREPQCYNIHLSKKQVISHGMVPQNNEVEQKELLAHLVYAETLAANCAAANASMVMPIAQVIFNRIRDFETSKKLSRSEAIKHAVFGKNQFNSSLSGRYSLSQWKEFVCPKNKELFQKAYEAVEKFSKSYDGDKDLTEGTNYFFHRHTGSYKDHPWNKKHLRELKNVSDGCLVIYKTESKDYLKAELQ